MMFAQPPEPGVLLSSVPATAVMPSMATYPTPPSSIEDSPQPIYFVASPNSNSFSSPPPQQQYNLQAHIMPDTDMLNLTAMNLDKRPYLRFIEQPTNKFRFRYKSEMAGTHGSLCGMNSDKSRKQTYPTVELMNCSEKATVRCSIYQYKIHEDGKPHPHRLIMKRGKDEYDDPHDIQVGPEEGFIATFHSMGIIHTARKNIVTELVKKKTQLKRELIARLEGRNRKLTLKEEMEIKGLAEQECKSINLNIVSLRFDAFIVKNDIWNPICEPIYSHGINNLKCALTGDLKIVRMDHCTSPAKGNKEVFLLVERVTKKNIRVRFFELDDEDIEVWEGYGKFSELDVHHQYAIVFKTPPYDRDPNIQEPVRVFMELVRPSDNARSEPKEFRYVPNNEFKPGSKRPRHDYSSSSYNSSSFSSGEIPATVNAISQPQAMNNTFSSDLNVSSWNNGPPLTEEQMMIALTDAHSDEFDKIFSMYGDLIPQEIYNSHKVDSPLDISKQLSQVHIGMTRGWQYNNRVIKQVQDSQIKMEVLKEDLALAERAISELKSFIKTKDASLRASEMLRYYLGEKNKTNALHVFTTLKKKEQVVFLLKMICLQKQYELTNVPNADSFTPLHLAVFTKNEEFVGYFLQCEADPCILDRFGKTALHIAIEASAGPKLIEMLLTNKHGSKLIDMENYEGDTPLHSAIEKKNMTAVKLLCRNGADINKKHQKNGFTPLRVAIENQCTDMVTYILNHPKFELGKQYDFKNISPYEAAHMKGENSDIFGLIRKYTDEKGIAMDIKQEVEDIESDEEMDEDIDIKEEFLIPSDDLNSLYEGITKFTPTCLDEVSAVLDESGKYQDLAELLDMSHLIHTGILSNGPSISKNVLLYAEKENVKILDIRNFLENLDEIQAVLAMDQMARELKLKH